MSDTFTRFVPSLETVTEFHKANFEAMVHAQTTLVKGLQEISKELVAQTQSHLEALALTGKSALAAKTIQDVVEVNVSGAKTSYEKLVAGTTKLGELGVQITTEAFAPIKARATATTEVLLKPIAA
jgi:phasin family protein